MNAQMLLARYGFEDSGTPNTPVMYPSFVNSALVEASWLSATGAVHTGHKTGVFGGGFAPYFENWPMYPQMFDSEKYVELTITSVAIDTATLDSVVFWKRMYGSQVMEFRLRSSQNSYGSNIFFSSSEESNEWRKCSVSLPSIKIVAGESITFRFYTGGAEEDSLTLEPSGMALDQISIYGSGDISTSIWPIEINVSDSPIYPNPASVGETVHISKNSHVVDMTGRIVQRGNETFVPQVSGVYFVGRQKLIVR